MRRRFLALGACLLLVAGCGGGATGPARRDGGAAGDTAPHIHGSDVDPTFDRFTMGSCAPSAPPLGAIPPTPPAWCGPLVAGRSTARVGANSWIDLFDNGLDHASFPDAYRIFEAARPSSRILRTKHFLHNGHWMVDIAGEGTQEGEYEDDRDIERADQNWGGALMRPDRMFRFEGGRLVVEFDVAAGMLAYHDGWPEVIVSTAPRPTGLEVDPIHAIGVFGGAATVGCRLYVDRKANCSAYDASGRPFDRGGRLFELSAISDEGAASAFGGAPTDPGVAAAWRLCAPADPDTNCRDRFRVEFARDAVRLFVNGTLYMAHSGLPAAKQLTGELLEGDVYVYFASWVYLGKAETERFHWGRIAINP